MYKNKKICIVVPAYNEATQIKNVIDTMPDFVDAVAVVNDASTDDTSKVVKDWLVGREDLFFIEYYQNYNYGGIFIT